MSSQLGEGSSLTNLVGNQVLGGDGNKDEKGERKRSIEEEESLVAKKSLKPSDEEEIEANINSRLPPELLAAIFRFLPLRDLKSALLVCRWEQIQIQDLYLILKDSFNCHYSTENCHIISVENLTCAGCGGTLVRIQVCGPNSSFHGPHRPSFHGPHRPGPGCRMSSP